VFLSQLQARHGWSAGVIGGATTLSLLVGAGLLPWVDRAIHRFGTRAVLSAGLVVLATGAVAFSCATEPWQLYPFGLLIGAGSAFAGVAAISIALAERFKRHRGLALSLALSGISVGGFTVTPALLMLAPRHGFIAAVFEVALGLLAMLLPIIWLGFKPASSLPRPAASDLSNRRALLTDAGFWSMAAPFALAGAAQIGVLVYQVSYLIPLLGTDGASLAVMCVGLSALLSRLAFGAVVDQVAPRKSSAAIFATQAISTAVLLGSPAHPAAPYLASVLLGVAAGTILTLPPLIIQREFPATCFGTVFGLAMAIAQLLAATIPVLLGFIHDAAGNYRAAFGICIAMPLIAMVMVLRPIPPRPRAEMPMAAGS
ncbi:MAG: MFS transporter, partial [Bradyrhizobium sp.]